MVTVEALHALTSELHAGFLTLAFVCIMIVAGCQIVVRFRNRMPKSFVNIAHEDIEHVKWKIFIHLTFIGSAILLAWTDKIMQKDRKH